jgi:hypothetical protein
VVLTSILLWPLTRREIPGVIIHALNFSPFQFWSTFPPYNTADMVHLTSTIALAALLLSSADAATMEAKGCYTNVTPPLKDMGPYDYQSSGWCHGVCTKAKKPVMALYQGSNCFCGDQLPPNSEKTSKDDCTAACNGFPQEYCTSPVSTFRLSTHVIHIT